MVDWHAAMIEAGPAAAHRDLQPAMPSMWPLGLSEIRLPTLIIVGSQDRMTPRGSSQELHDGIAGARTIEGAGHMFMLERPEMMGSILLVLEPGCSRRRRTVSERGNVGSQPTWDRCARGREHAKWALPTADRGLLPSKEALR